MIAAFHSTGAKYGRKNLRWLFRMPSAHADSTSTPVIGKRMRTTAIMSSRRCALETRREHADEHRREQHAEQRDRAGDAEQQREHRTGDAPGFLRAALAEQRRVRGNERRAERAFAEQVLQHVRHAQPGAEHVGVQARAEVRRDHALADQADDAAQQDAEADEERGRARSAAPARGPSQRRLALGCRHQRIVTSSSALVG